MCEVQSSIREQKLALPGGQRNPSANSHKTGSAEGSVIPVRVIQHCWTTPPKMAFHTTLRIAHCGEMQSLSCPGNELGFTASLEQSPSPHLCLAFSHHCLLCRAGKEQPKSSSIPDVGGSEGSQIGSGSTHGPGQGSCWHRRPSQSSAAAGAQGKG